MPSASGRSTAPSRRQKGRRAAVDVYLFPSVVGGGLGDIEEVLAAGRELSRAGFRIVLYRRAGTPLPRSVEGPWDWPPVERRMRIAQRAPSALTVSAAWGISAGPSRPEPFGRGGPWELESRDVESAYGTGSTIHVSLEEFARTLGAAAENRERLREGGVRDRELPGRLAVSERAGEVGQFRTAFTRFRGFTHPNVLHLFATFRANPGFAREFPEAVQTGPLWPRRSLPPSERRSAAGRREWVWYASPASAERLAPEVVAGLEDSDPPVQLYIRTDRPWKTSFPSERVEVTSSALDPVAWRRRFARADLRIVTGSRSLLEAIELGGPFLYFNGVMGEGAQRRRHRPEKVVALLDAARAVGTGVALRRDLADFARGRRVGSVVRNAAARSGGWDRFPARLGPIGFSPPYDDAGHLVVAVARALERTPTEAVAIVERIRTGSIL
jgi:hypothetical protein